MLLRAASRWSMLAARPRVPLRHAQLRPPPRLPDELAEGDEIHLARRAAPPREPDRAAGLRVGEAQKLDPLVAHLDVDGNARHQCDAVAVGDHLHDGCEAGGAEAERGVAPRAGAI